MWYSLLTILFFMLNLTPNNERKIMKTLITLAIMLLATSAFAGTVNFTWPASDAPDLAGYRIFQRDGAGEYDYTAPIAEIEAGTEVCVVESVPDGDYSWVMRVFDFGGNESVDSNECSLLIDDPPGPIVGFG